jgi:hypothetical protein
MTRAHEIVAEGREQWPEHGTIHNVLGSLLIAQAVGEGVAGREVDAQLRPRGAQREPGPLV